MSYKYTWKVLTLSVADAAGLQKAVISVKWQLSGEDSDGNIGKFFGTTPFSVENLNAGSFVEYSALTEENIISWILPIVQNNATYKKHIDEQIAKEILRTTSNLKRDHAVPWAPGNNAATSEPAPV